MPRGSRLINLPVQTLLLPPIFALLLYLLTTYLILPHYRRLRARSSYALLPSSLTPSSPTSLSFANGLVSRVNAFIGRESRRRSGESLMGDEELEEQFTTLPSTMLHERDDMARLGEADDRETRLSRDLERGFRDSSDEEEDNRRRAWR